MSAPTVINLQGIARQTLKTYGFLTDFPAPALAQAAAAVAPAYSAPTMRDCTNLLWSSIDNDESRDLDQIETIEATDGGFRLSIGIANVDHFVPKGSPLDDAAGHNTTSLYTGVETFPMLPPRLSTDLSSLAEGQKRLAIIVELQLDPEGRVTASDVYPGIVQNKAQLTYDAVATWLAMPPGTTPSSVSETTQRMLRKIRGDPALQEQLKFQDQVALALRERRHEAGALSFVTTELQPSIGPDGNVALKAHQPDEATQLIEDFMIAANQATVRFLESKGFPTLRRVVRTPKRWDRIVSLAAALGTTLPTQPDALSLEKFLTDRQQRDPDHFPDLSLSIIKLLGRGEYVVQMPGGESPGHFGLAVQNYAHSTAPNRRYPDLITQRLLLAALAKSTCPYSADQLQQLAQHCTEKEDDANKAERAVRKCAAALALRPRIGETFDGFITGASDKGTWVRIVKPPVEGKISNPGKVDVGDRVQVRLSATDPERGFIDFELLSR